MANEPHPEHSSWTAQAVSVQRVTQGAAHLVQDVVTVEQPLQIELDYGLAHSRIRRSVSVTMRTPGHDAELALGFLCTEGVLPQDTHPDDVSVSSQEELQTPWGPDAALAGGSSLLVSLADTVHPRVGSLERNFYATSSCGVCGKASLLALRSVSPPRRANDFVIDIPTLISLPAIMRSAQGNFHRTGGLHAAALFSATGNLAVLREDVGRHNAVDKLVGVSMLADTLPLHDQLLLLSGRVSFELMQKAVMAGVPCVAAIGAPSSLAVEVAQAFDVTLVGFLRDDHFNVYHGASHIA